MNNSQSLAPRHDVAPISVRALTSADAEAYRRVRLDALHEQPPAFGAVPEDEPTLAELAARLPETKDRSFLGAFQGEELAGIIRLSRYSAANEKHRAYLAGLYVLPRFRRHGCGRALVRESLSRATKAGDIRRVNLTVVAQQEAAIRLYESFGFRIYGTEQETFSCAGKFYDEHLMTLVLAHEKAGRSEAIEIEMSESPTAQETEFLFRNLAGFNEAQAGPASGRGLAIIARRGNEIVAGLIGRTHWNWFDIRYLWVAEEHRRHGLGRKLMLAAEREASARGCEHAHLDTFSFQAAPFYERLGYSVFGCLEEYPPGHSRVFLQKRLL